MATRIDEQPGVRRRIIVDCTHTFHTGAFTGIQRVVRHFADGLLEIAAERSIEVVPVRIAGRAMVRLPLRDGRVDFPRASSAREAPNESEAQRRLARLRGLGHRLNFLRARPISRWLDAGPNSPGLARFVERQEPQSGEDVQARAGDVLLSLDSSWVYPIRDALDEAGRAGATRIAMLCDVLPLRQPEAFTEGTRLWFGGWLRALLPRLDGLLTISDATARDLQALVAEGALGALEAPRCATVHLGADLVAAGDPQVRPALRALLAPGAPTALLTVGTLEPRKNYDYALDIFDVLVARGLPVHWHFVGAPGWLADETVARIRSHPRFGTALHWWTDLSDGELAWLYAQADALVAVSRAEGYGLPLAEARFHGLPVFASDIPVFREVLQGEGRFLPLGGAALAAAILEDFVVGALAMPSTGAVSRAARTWRERSAELLDAVLRMRRS